MSHKFAIAGVAAALRETMLNALAAPDVISTFTVQPKVTSVSLNWMDPEDKNPSLNILLYEVAPNPGWANETLPGRDPRGARTANTILALDLTYLFTAFTSRDFEAEILLGCAAQALHETPALPRSFIEVLANGNGGLGGLTEAGRRHLLSLAKQAEPLRITPRFLKADEMLKLWSSFQIPYRPSVAYQVSVVLIDLNRAIRPSLPVLRRGPENETGRAEANVLPPFPTLITARPPRRLKTLHAVKADSGMAANFDVLRLYGHHLAGTARTVIFQHTTHSKLSIVVPAGGITEQAPDFTYTELEDDETLQSAETQLNVKLEAGGATWSPGVYTVRVQVTPPGEAVPRESDALSVAIMPEFFLAGNPPLIVTKKITVKDGVTTIPLQCRQLVRKGQTVALLLDGVQLAGEPVFSGTEATQDLSFSGKLPPAMSKTPRARLLVDGIESPIVLDVTGQPLKFDPAQKIILP